MEDVGLEIKEVFFVRSLQRVAEGSVKGRMENVKGH